MPHEKNDGKTTEQKPHEKSRGHSGPPVAGTEEARNRRFVACPECDSEEDATSERCSRCGFPISQFGEAARVRRAFKKLDGEELARAQKPEAEKDSERDESRRKQKSKDPFWSVLAGRLPE